MPEQTLGHWAVARLAWCQDEFERQGNLRPPPIKLTAIALFGVKDYLPKDSLGELA